MYQQIKNESFKEVFYRRLQSTTDNYRNENIKVLMNDLTAKIGLDNTGNLRNLEVMNDNGKLFTNLCARN